MENEKPRMKHGSPEFRAFMQANGRKGGRINVERHGVEHLREIGRAGGEALLAKRGKEHFAAIGKMNKKGDNDE